MKKIHILLLLGSCLIGVTARADVRLPKIFGDHMVFQREKPIVIWGNAQPHEPIRIRIHDIAFEGEADSDGTFQFSLPELPLGGPYTLTVEGQNTITINNVLSGDVWFASGQSNMRWKVRQGILNKEEEIAKADYPNIRMFNVPLRAEALPIADVSDGNWQVCAPTTVSDYSATAYFYAREVYERTGVPQGIILSAYGGSVIEAWLSGTAHRDMPELMPSYIDSLNQLYGNWNKFIPENEKAYKKILYIADSTNRGYERGVAKSNFDDSGWQTTELFWERPAKNQVWWLRKNFELGETPNIKSMEFGFARPALNAIFYVNNRLVGRVRNKKYRGTFPARFLKKGKNTIAVRLAHPWRPPLMAGTPDEVYLKSSDEKVRVGIGGLWKYSEEIEEPYPKLYRLKDVPSALYNTMVHPFINYRIRGFLWYQGESSVSMGAKYKDLLTLLMSDWRILWNDGHLPFYYVQLPNFGRESDLVDDSQWPILREAQRHAQYFPNTGMACTIDVGEADDVHPKNKQAVGYRLALLALAKTYGMASIEFTGPRYATHRMAGQEVFLTFDHADGLHTNDGLPIQGFALAGADGVYYKADASLAGGGVIKVTSDQVVKPTYVRYGFAGNPVTNLYNEAKLPAVPFQVRMLE